MAFEIRRWVTAIDEKYQDGELRSVDPLRRVAIGLVLTNPFLADPKQDFAPWIDASAELGIKVGERFVQAIGGTVQSYGKAGLVGVRGEQEHANALLTTTFARPIRGLIGGGKAWIPSVTKVAAVGSSIDVPLAHKDALYVRSHYDALTLTFGGGPAPDEVILIFAGANRGRLNPRVGGLRHEEVVGNDGLR